MLSWSQLKARGACHSVFYCSPACQKKDWTTRHKPLCKKYTASKQSAVTGAGTSAQDRQNDLNNASGGLGKSATRH